MEKKVSIIIPVYNKEKYLDRCMKSLIDLDMDKDTMEVICVDDLSTDSSLQIINRYAENHDFIRVIALDENSGSPARPRNIGMSEAGGTYLALLDADDWLDSEGFPALLEQMAANDADIGFGQSYKHTSKSVSRIARFASYKDANGLVPHEIEKIFRAVGPPGKIFRKSVVREYNIEFEDLKFGEDKLFFVNLIARCRNASMTRTPVYHVNRQSDNASLVKETSALDKASINIEILKKILEMDLPGPARKDAITRIVEVDMIRRFFHTRTFLKSFEKERFYELFDEFERLFPENNLDIRDYIQMDRFRNIYHLYKNAERDDFIEYIEYLVDDKKRSRYIKDNVVHARLPGKFSDLIPITEECHAVYGGTHQLDGEYYDIIKIYRRPDVTIDNVYMTRISDETMEQAIDFELRDDTILIRTEDMIMDGTDINLRIVFDGYKSTLVHATPPNGSEHYMQNRENFKTEFKEEKHRSMVPAGDYITALPESVVNVKTINSYADEEFETVVTGDIMAGCRFDIAEVSQSKSGTPRLKTTDGTVITANRKFVKKLDRTQTAGYLTDKPEKVRIIKKCRMYDSRAFDNDPVKTLEAGEELFVSGIVYTNSLTPRLKIRDSYFVTANLDYVQAVR